MLASLASKKSLLEGMTNPRWKSRERGMSTNIRVGEKKASLFCLGEGRATRESERLAAAVQKSQSLGGEFEKKNSVMQRCTRSWGFQ